MKKLALTLAVACAFFTNARADQTNLIPNGDLSDKTNPMKGMRTDFPYQEPYVKNVNYVKIATDKKSKNGGNCIVIDFPGGMEGAKVETEPVKCEPGATYKAEVDLGSGAKVFAEAWITDPRPEQKRNIFRAAAMNGAPAMVMVHRWQFGKPIAHEKGWSTVTTSTPLVVPKTVKVNATGEPGGGADVPPEFLTIKVFFEKKGKSYVSNFRLYKIK